MEEKEKVVQKREEGYFGIEGEGGGGFYQYLKSHIFKQLLSH